MVLSQTGRFHKWPICSNLPTKREFWLLLCVGYTTTSFNERNYEVWKIVITLNYIISRPKLLCRGSQGVYVLVHNRQPCRLFGLNRRPKIKIDWQFRTGFEAGEPLSGGDENAL